MVDIKTTLIFEMLGRPPEHLQSTLAQFIDKLGREKGIEITNKNLNEPKKIEQSKQEIYSAFAEVEANIKDIDSLIKIVFTYMPSHIEISSPTEISIKNFELNSIVTGLALKLHKYDELAKVLAMERNFLRKKLQENTNKVSENKEEAEKKTKKAEKKKKGKKKK